jgi:hypothetical protein
MLTKSRAWRDMIKTRELSRSYVWFMMEKQFWPRVAYGLCTVLALYKVLLECLMSTLTARSTHKAGSGNQPEEAIVN